MLELLQQPDAFGSVWMRTEHQVHLRDKARKPAIVFFVGMDYIELRHVFAPYLAKARRRRYLPQSRGKRHRISAEFGPTCIGHIFTPARNRKPRKCAKEERDR